MKKRKIKWIITLVVLAVLAAMVVDSGCRLVTTEYTVASESLPASFEGYTIVQLSDIHGSQFGRDNARLIKKTAETKPDMIALTGDLADSDTDMAVIDSLLGELSKIAPVYYVSGNHEWGTGCIEELKEIFARQGVSYLSNSYEVLRRGDDSIILAGVEDPNSYANMPRPDDVVETIEKEQGEGFRVLLGHRNYWAERYPKLDVDLIFCGHAHGGIVRLPWFGGVLGTGFEFFPENVDGAVESGRYTMIVSRGIGNSIPVPRFLNNPEIVVVKLEKE